MVSLGLKLRAAAFLLLHLGLQATAGASQCWERKNGTLDWTNALEQAEAFVAQLTLDEKISMITGNASEEMICIGYIAPIPRLGFPGICLNDGPNTLNRADRVSVFPSGLTAASTWDEELIYQRGVALGQEARGKGVNVLLGPSAGPMGRHALGGRNWEGFGPDPYLAGVALGASVRGIQDNGVQTCSKHFIGNEQETQRSNSTGADGVGIEAVSSNIDDRTLHELYLWPFVNAIKDGTTCIMCSYNRVNGVYVCEHPGLLQDVLREELGFLGYVSSDWFATHSTVESINAGLGMEMPGELPKALVPVPSSFFADGVATAVGDGAVDESKVDEMVRGIMASYYLMGQDCEDFPTPDPSGKYFILAQEVGLEISMAAGLIPPGFEFPRGRDVRGDHGDFIRRSAAEGTILLKNVNNTLPLRQPQVIGVFGNDAPDVTDGLAGEWSDDLLGMDIGTLAIGGGSGSGCLSYLVSPLDAIKVRARKIGAQVIYITNNEVLAANNFRGVYPPPETCIVFQKSYASEGNDRASFELDRNSTAVINNVANYCGNTIVVTHSGGVNTMPWADHPKIGAILAAHYPGQESGNSIVDVLWGDVNPSGHLPYTIPFQGKDAGPPIVNLSQPVTDPNAWQSDFTDGQFIDYRHYDALNITPRYEFGFGLSYTTFDIPASPPSVIRVTKGGALLNARPDPSQKIQPGGHPELWEDVVAVRTEVKNTGPAAGSAVPQLYVSFPASTPDGVPLKVLRGFRKIHLKPGKSAEVEFRLARRDLSYWDEKDRVWVIPEGEFVFHVGLSSRDLRSRSAFAVL
ncbi:beta-glucosidase [Aspergillus varians]